MRKNLFLLTILLFCLSVFSQKNTCETSETLIEDISDIEKCSTTTFKDNKESSSQQNFKKRNRFLRKRSEKRKNTVISLSSQIKEMEASIYGLVEEDWNDVKLIAKAISETSNLEEANVSFNSVEKIPLFKNCKKLNEDLRYSCFNTEMSKHIKKHFKHPKKALKSYVQGSIVLEFTIDKKGQVTNIQTTGHKNVKLLKKEAIRVVEKLPDFIPGSHDGKAVNVKYVMPINFKY